MISIISNISVFLGALAIFIVNGEKYRRLGAWLGLIAQPAWFYIAISTEQWGVLAGAVIYTVGWIRGIISNKTKPFESKSVYSTTTLNNQNRVSYDRFQELRSRL